MADIDLATYLRNFLASQEPRVPLSGVVGPDGQQAYAEPATPEPPPGALQRAYNAVQPYPINPMAMIEGAMMTGLPAGAQMPAVVGRAGEALSSVLKSNPRTSGAGALTLGLSTASDAAGPQSQEKRAIQDNINDVDPVLKSLLAEIEKQRSIANADPKTQVKSNRERAQTELTRLTAEYNQRLSDMTKAQLPFDQAFPWYAQNRAWVNPAAAMAMGYLTHNAGNMVGRAQAAPWNRTVSKADRACEKAGGDVADPAFRYYAGRAGSHLENAPGAIMSGAGEVAKFAMPPIAGGLTGAELAALPHQYNKFNTPEGSTARQAADKALGEDLTHTLGVPAFIGAMSGLTGAHLPGVNPAYQPRAESSHLSKVLKEGLPTPPSGSPTPGAPGPAGAPTPAIPGPAGAPMPAAPPVPGSPMGGGGPPPLPAGAPQAALPPPGPPPLPGASPNPRPLPASAIPSNTNKKLPKGFTQTPWGIKDKKGQWSEDPTQ